MGNTLKIFLGNEKNPIDSGENRYPIEFSHNRLVYGKKSVGPMDCGPTFVLLWSGWQRHPIKDSSPYLNTTQIKLASLDNVVC